MKQLDGTTFGVTEKADLNNPILIEVGDMKRRDRFYPQSKILRWGNEVNFSMCHVETDADEPTIFMRDDVVVYAKPDIEVHQYIKPGEMEFEWILKKMPRSPLLQATIQTKGLEFIYQPPLTREEIAEGVNRPPEIVGSYAAYRPNTFGTMVGGMDYQTGKVFHIYRPKAIDALGQEVWCDLLIENGLKTVTVPLDFLMSATYPIRVDPTFGFGSQGGTSATAFNEAAYATIFTLLDSGASIQKLTSWRGGDGAHNTKGMIWSDSGAYPFILQGASTAQPGGTGTNAVIDQVFSPNFTLVAGSYWLGWADQAGSNSTYWYDTGFTNQRYGQPDSHGDYTTPPSPYPGAGTGSNRKVSIFATYTARGPMPIYYRPAVFRPGSPTFSPF